MKEEQLTYYNLPHHYVIQDEGATKSQYTQEHERSQTEHRQSHIRDVAEDPNLGTYSDRGF